MTDAPEIPVDLNPANADEAQCGLPTKHKPHEWQERQGPDLFLRLCPGV